MKIAVYSGSFNPMHIGHEAIIRYITEKMDFDGMYLIVSPQNPLKGAGDDPSGKRRLEAAREAVRRHGLKARVDDIETTMPAPQYTIRTLDALKRREPDNEFTLVIGADNLDRMHLWKDYRRILSEYGVLVYPRKGYDMKRICDGLMAESGKYRITLADAPTVDVSSRMILSRRSLEPSSQITVSWYAGRPFFMNTGT